MKTSLKKLLCVTLCVAMLVSMFSISAFAKPSYTYNTMKVSNEEAGFNSKLLFAEDFAPERWSNVIIDEVTLGRDQVTVGKADVKTGIMRGNRNNASAGLNNGLTVGDTGYLKFKHVYKRGIHFLNNDAEKPTYFSGRYVTEFKFKQDSYTKMDALFRAVGVDTDGTAFKHPLLQLDVDGNLYYYDTSARKIGQTKLGEWNTVKLVLDVDNEKYDIYFNGSLAKKDALFGGSNALNDQNPKEWAEGAKKRIDRFFDIEYGYNASSNDAERGVTYYDDIKIYRVNDGGDTWGLVPITENLFEESFAPESWNGVNLDANALGQNKITVGKSGPQTSIMKGNRNNASAALENGLTVGDTGYLKFKHVYKRGIHFLNNDAEKPEYFSGRYVTEFKFKQDSYTKMDALFRAAGVDAEGTAYKHPLLQLDVDGNLYYYDTSPRKLVQFVPGEWNTVKLILDVDNEKYDIYFNGVLLKKDALFGGSNAINDKAVKEWPEGAKKRIDRFFDIEYGFNANSNDAERGITYYDDIKIYREPMGRTTVWANDLTEYENDVIYNESPVKNFAGLGNNFTAAVPNAKLNAQAGAIEFAKGGSVSVRGFSGTFSDNASIAFDFVVSALPSYEVQVFSMKESAGATYGTSIFMKDSELYVTKPGNVKHTLISDVKINKPYRITLHTDLTKEENGIKGAYDVYVNGVCKANGIKIRDGKGNAASLPDVYRIMNVSMSAKDDMILSIKNPILYKDVREEVMALAANDVITAFGDSRNIGNNVILPRIYTSDVGGDSNYTVTWTSSDMSAYNPDTGVVTKTANDQPIRITASVQDIKGEYRTERYFDFVIPDKVDKDNIAGDSENLADIPGWNVVKGTPVAAENPTSDTDRAVRVNAGDEAYKALVSRTGIVQITADLYLSDSDAGTLYLADDNANRFAEVNFDKYTVSCGKIENSDMLAHGGYAGNSWFTVKIVADMLKRSFDLYFDDLKVNKAPVSFNEDSNDNAILARIGFEGIEGKLYADNIVVGHISENTGLILSEIIYSDENGARLTPVAGGKVSSVKLSNTESGQTAAVFVALYDAQDRLISCRYNDAGVLETGINNIPITDANIPTDWSDNHKVKVFVWNNPLDLQPALSKEHTDKVSAVYLAGDSTVADYKAESYPYTGWGTAFKECLDSEKASVVNMAMADCTAKEFVDKKLTDLRNRITPGDYVFVSFGYDDAIKNSSEEEFKNSIRSIAEAAKQNGAEVVLVTSPDAKNTSTDTYNAYMQDLAAEFETVVLNLDAAWAEFMANTSDDESYYGSADDAELLNDYRWSVSVLNTENAGYNSEEADKDGRLSPQGAKKAADIVAKLISSCNIAVKEAVKEPDAFKYSEQDGILTVSGNGDLPVYASFEETPWASLKGRVTEIKLAEGITSISSRAFSEFKNLTAVHIPESVETICTNAFPENKIFTVWGYYNSAAQAFAEDNEQTEFSLTKLRLMSVGNSHTLDYLQWKNNIFNDLKNAGLTTNVEFSECLVGAAQMYFHDYKYGGENTPKSHYLQGSNPNSPKYHGAEYTRLRNGKYDLILIQDFRESILEMYSDSFVDAMAKVVRWLRSTHPDADIAWVADWTDVDSAKAHTDRSKLKTQWTQNGAPMIEKVEAMKSDKPDFIVPMGTALQNARSSYLGGVYNAADCYTNRSNPDWAQPENIMNYTILERDGTHCSHELGRYLVSVAVFGKIFTEYKDILGGVTDNFDYYAALETMPETSGSNLWRGDITQSAFDIICESAQNAIANPTVVTDSIYTVDPADEIAENIQKLTFSAMTADEIVRTVNGANLGIAISGNDVTINPDDSTKASVKFLYGYTEKTVEISVG